MIKGYTKIDECWHEGIFYYLYESKAYGDEAPHMVTDSDFNLVCYTWDDLSTALRDYFE